MPPGSGPLSPSSRGACTPCAAGRSSTVRPSVATSSPSRNASMTDYAAGVAELVIAEHRLHGGARVPRVAQTIAPLPAPRARTPSPPAARGASRRSERSLQVGDLARRSGNAAAITLQKRLRRRCRARVRRFGPDDYQLDSAIHVGRIGDAIDVVGGDERLVASSAVPGDPGAQTIMFRFSRWSAQQSARSRPPPPRTRPIARSRTVRRSVGQACMAWRTR